MRTETRIKEYQNRRNEHANSICDQVLAGKNPQRPYFVYLRPFYTDDAFVWAPRQGGDKAYVEKYGWPTTYHDLESALALLVYQYGDFVALSKNIGKAGAGYVQKEDVPWQEVVLMLCKHAEGIFVVPFDFEGTASEIKMLIEQGWLGKTLFIMPASPPISRLILGNRHRDYRSLWEAGRIRYDALNLPEYDKRGAVVLVGDTVQVLNGFGGMRLTTSYRDQQKRDLEILHSLLAELTSADKSS